MTSSEILFLVSVGGALITIAFFINAITINIKHLEAEFFELAEFLNNEKKNYKEKNQNK